MLYSKVSVLVLHPELGFSRSRSHLWDEGARLVFSLQENQLAIPATKISQYFTISLCLSIVKLLGLGFDFTFAMEQ